MSRPAFPPPRYRSRARPSPPLPAPPAARRCRRWRPVARPACSAERPDHPPLPHACGRRRAARTAGPPPSPERRGRSPAHWPPIAADARLPGLPPPPGRSPPAPGRGWGRPCRRSGQAGAMPRPARIPRHCRRPDGPARRSWPRRSARHSSSGCAVRPAFPPRPVRGRARPAPPPNGAGRPRRYGPAPRPPSPGPARRRPAASRHGRWRFPATGQRCRRTHPARCGGSPGRAARDHRTGRGFPPADRPAGAAGRHWPAGRSRRRGCGHRRSAPGAGSAASRPASPVRAAHRGQGGGPRSRSRRSRWPVRRHGAPARCRRARPAPGPARPAGSTCRHRSRRSAPTGRRGSRGPAGRSERRREWRGWSACAGQKIFRSRPNQPFFSRFSEPGPPVRLA